MQIRGITKADYDHLISVLDRWWGGPAGQHAHPLFFYEFGKHALVADEGDLVVGFLLGFVAPGEPSVGYIHLVGIHPDHRRRGVGKALYERFMERCVDQGVGQLRTIAAVGHDGSRAFHEALGFDGRVDADYAGPGRARVVFEKTL